MLDNEFWSCGGTGILCGTTRGAMLAVAPAAVNGAECATVRDLNAARRQFPFG